MADNLDNTAGLIGAVHGELTIAADTLDNTQGRLEAERDLTLDVAGTLRNAGGEIVQLGEGDMQLSARQLQGDEGLIVSQGELAIQGEVIHLAGALTQAGHIDIQAGHLDHRGGEMRHLGEASPLALDINGELDNREGVILSAADLSLNAGELNNADGLLHAEGGLTVEAGSIGNRQGELFAAGDVGLRVRERLDNTLGHLIAREALHIEAGGVDNRAGLMGALRGGLILDADEIDNTQGRLEAERDLTLDVAGTLINRVGELLQFDDGEIRLIAQHLAGSDGVILGQGELTLTVEEAQLDGATTQAERITLVADRLDHRGGEMLHFGHSPLALRVRDEFDNSAGLIVSQSALELDAGMLHNAGGILHGEGDVTLHADELDNRQGELFAGRDLRLNLTGTLDNRQGQMIAVNDLAIEADQVRSHAGLIAALDGALQAGAHTLDNTQGRLEAQGDLTLAVTGALINDTGDILQLGQGDLHIDARELAGQAGIIASQGGLRLWGETLDLSHALTQAEHIDLSADALDHRGGDVRHLSAATPLRLVVEGDLNNQGGLISSEAGLDLRAGALNNASGLIHARQTLALDADSLDNQSGELFSGDALRLDVVNNIDNTQGQLLAQHDAEVRAGALNNADGTLAAVAGDLNLTSQAAIDNQGGTLDAGGQLDLDTQGLDNRDGQIIAERITLNTHGQALDNSTGLIAAFGGLELASGALNNHRGTLQAGGDLHLDTQGQVLINTDSGSQGGILAGGELRIDSGTLNNAAGVIGGASLRLLARAIDNTLGTLLSEGDLSLDADSLDNREGQLQALNDAQLRVVQFLDNTRGLLRAGDELDIAAERLRNTDTSGNGQGVEGPQVRIAAAQVENDQGAIRANEYLAIDTQALTNQAGLLSSLHTLVLESERLDNRKGTLIANQALNVTSGDLQGNGRMLSLGDMALRLSGDITLDAADQWQAQGDFSLTTDGVIANHGLLAAGGQLDLEAQALTNAREAELTATRLRVDTDRLTNHGLIDGIDVRLDADILDNLGGGRIYGDQLSLQAGILTNAAKDGQAPVIAARDRLDIGAQRLANRDDALIFSIGDMAIAGRLDANGHATGQAQRIDNNSATIEALGNLHLATGELYNTNEYFETTEVEAAIEEKTYFKPLRRDGTYHMYSGVPYVHVIWGDKKIPESEFAWRLYDYPSYGHPIEALVHWPTQQAIELWEVYDIERTELRNEVVKSLPGKILAGSSMELIGNELINDKSQILAGGHLAGDLDNLENRRAEGGIHVIERGVKWINYNWEYTIPNVTAEFLASIEPYEAYYTLDDTETLPIGEVRGNSGHTGTSLDLSAPSNITVAGSAQGAGNAQAEFRFNQTSGIIEVPVMASSGEAFSGNAHRSERQVDGTTAQRQASSSERNLQGEAVDGGASLGEQTLGGITAERQAFSSGRHPQGEAVHAGAAEVIRTVMPSVNPPNNSLFQIRPEATAPVLIETDPRFTDRQQWVGSDYMLQALQQDPTQVHKRLGDGFYEQRLVREQIAQLTGQRFLEGHNDDQAQFTALMNAGITFAEEHDLRPGVALTAEQMAQLTSDIVWLVEQEVELDDGSTVTVLVPQVYVRVREGDLTGDGTLIAGNSLQLDIAGDLLNSGTLAGREVMDISAKNIANLGGRISGNRVNLEANRDITNIEGRIDGAQVHLDAGRDIANLGGDMSARERLDLQAGRDIANLGGDMSARERLELQAGRDITIASTERLAGLYVSDGAGQLLASAGRDIAILGAEVNSAGDLQLTAGRDLEIASTLNHEQRWGGISERSEIEHGATLHAGGDLILGAGRDLSLTAAEVSAQGSGLLSAGRDLSLNALEVGSSVNLGRSLTSVNSSETGTRLDVGGSAALVAGQDITARAAEITSGDDLALAAGGDITLESGLSQQYQESRRGRTHTIERHSQVQRTALDAGGNLALEAGNDLTLSAAQLRAGSDASLFAGNRIELLTAQEEDYAFYESSRSGGLFRSRRHQRDETHDVREIGSEMMAEGDIALVSGGDQTYRGARLESGQDLSLIGGGEITFDTASDIRTESHERSRSNALSQSARGHGSTRETLRQNELMAQGDIRIHAEQGIHALYEARDGESLDAAIERVVANDPDLAWLQTLQGRDDVTWESIEAFRDEWRYSQSGLSPIATTILTAVVSYYTAGAVSGMVGNLSGAAAGSQATFAAGATTASGTTIAAGSGNAILSGMAGGAAGGGIGAFSQGGDWREAAWRGGMTGGFTGYLSGGTFYDNPITLTQDAGKFLAEANFMDFAKTAMYVGMQPVISDAQKKMAEELGMNPDELNWLLMASSIAGDSILDENKVRYKREDDQFSQSDSIGGRGWLHRGFRHTVFDAVDTALTYQGLPTNTVRNYLYDTARPAEYNSFTGHSLGTGDAAYLARYGHVEQAYLHSLPLGIVAPPNAEVTLGSWDVINGGRLGLLLNWDANVVPAWPWQHPFGHYYEFIETSD
ncbi:hemagglutinin repeat-containing protein [Billgrantia endophytica]|nr:hemagglutinin repeat-containing protein [Halomonas endophytica]